MKKVDIYTGPLCAFCDFAKALLKRKNIPFNEIYLGDNPEKMEEMLTRSNGAKTVPQIFIGDYHVGGNKQLHTLEREGKLDSFLKD